MVLKKTKDLKNTVSLSDSTENGQWVNDSLWVGPLKAYESFANLKEDAVYVITDDNTQNNLVADDRVSEKHSYSSKKIENLISGIVTKFSEYFTLYRLKQFLNTTEFKFPTTKFSFPSKKSINLPVAITDTIYDAIADGFVMFKQVNPLTGCFIALENLDTGLKVSTFNRISTNNLCSVYFPIKAEEKFKIIYTGASEDFELKFIYAEGEA